MKRVKIMEKSLIMRYKEFSQCFFLLSGVACVYVYDEDTDIRYPFQYLAEGSAFNISNCILDHYSLFEIEAETDCVFMSLDYEQIKEAMKVDVKFHDIIE